MLENAGCAKLKMRLCVQVYLQREETFSRQDLGCRRVGNFCAQIKGASAVLCFPNRNGWLKCEWLFFFRLSHAAMDRAIDFLGGMRCVGG